MAELEATLAKGMAALLADPRLVQAGRLVLAGSGDSWFAARAIVPALRRWTGLPAVALPAMEAARYEIPLMRPGDLLVAISATGNSARVREAVTLAKKLGISTLGVAGSLTGPLAQAADLVLHRPVADPDGPPP